MGKQNELMPRETAYRWLAGFFLQPLDLSSYREPSGQQFLSLCRTLPALVPAAEMVGQLVEDKHALEQSQARLTNAHRRAFDMGHARSAPPYASVYLSERGLLYQRPARDMNKILNLLEMKLPEGLKEPADHLGIQLHVAAELSARETSARHVPLSCTGFLVMHVLNWLPPFLSRCEVLQDPELIVTFAQAVQKLALANVAASNPCDEVM